MFVVGRGLWSLCVAALLEEEGSSFDHEEALTEAGKRKRWKINSGLKKAIKEVFFFFLQCGVDICSTLSHPVCGEETLTLSLKHQASIDERCVSMVLQTKHWLNC